MNLKNIIQLKFVLGMAMIALCSSNIQASCSASLSRDERNHTEDLTKIKALHETVKKQIEDNFRGSRVIKTLEYACGKVAQGASILGGLSLLAIPFAWDHVLVQGKTRVDNSNPILFALAWVLNSHDHIEAKPSDASRSLWRWVIKFGLVAFGSYILKKTCSKWAATKEKREGQMLQQSTDIISNINKLNTALTEFSKQPPTLGIFPRFWLFNKNKEAQKLNETIQNYTCESSPLIYYSPSISTHLGSEVNARELFENPYNKACGDAFDLTLGKPSTLQNSCFIKKKGEES